MKHSFLQINKLLNVELLSFSLYSLFSLLSLNNEHDGNDENDENDSDDSNNENSTVQHGLLYAVEYVGANIVRPPTLRCIRLRAMAAH